MRVEDIKKLSETETLNAMCNYAEDINNAVFDYWSETSNYKGDQKKLTKELVESVWNLDFMLMHFRGLNCLDLGGDKI